MGVFGGRPRVFEGVFQFAQIFRERRGFPAAPVAGWFFAKKIGIAHDGTSTWRLSSESRPRLLPVAALCERRC